MKNILLLALTGSVLFAQSNFQKLAPQPDKATYAVSELEIFQKVTRENFKQHFGFSAAPCRTDIPVKTWLDPDAIGSIKRFEYNSVSQAPDGSPFITTVSLSAQAAASVNLPGREPIAPYVPTPTPATVVNEEGLSIPLNPNVLSTFPQASAILVELKRLYPTASIVELPVPDVQWNGEARRAYHISTPLARLNVGYLLGFKQNIPGSWVLTRGEVAWAPSAVADDCGGNAAFTAVPIRSLLPNEKLIASPFGVSVVRSDLQPTVGSGSGSFTDADREMLREILRRLGGE